VKPLPAIGIAVSFVRDGDVRPAFQVRGQVLVKRLVVVGAQEVERAVREDHTEAERRGPRVALEDRDVVGGVAPSS
jgi:hypothetical protein